MTPKHTPGPWYSNSDIIISEKTGATIAVSSYTGNAADTALLAAAPDLLQAVKDALDVISDIRAELDRFQPPLNIERRLEQLIYKIEEV